MQANMIVSHHETWSIIDPSKLTTYMTCPRKYFFRYILGWESTYPNNDLVFGSAWHVAMEHLLLNDYTDNAIVDAVELFFRRYRQELGPETDDSFGAKTPANAIRAITTYADRFKCDVDNYTVLNTEVAGRVKLGDDAILVVRMDCIRQDKDNGLIEVLDHKSSGRRINGWDRLQWQSTQIMSYMHLIYSLWDYNQVKGGRIRCSFIYTKDYKFEEVLVEKSPDEMQSFLTDILTYYDYLRRDMYLLMETCSDDEISMPAFPRNTESCYKYNKVCQYFDMCAAWSNPLRECHEVPQGYRQVYWNPLDDERIKFDVDLT